MIYNPIFGGYGHIIGSDGDLFADGTLFEIKTTIKKGITSQYVRQLLSYVALNRLKSVVPPIERIGIIMPRQGMSWTAPVLEVCSGAGIGDVTRLTRAIKNRLTQKPQGSPELRLPGPSRWSKPAITKSPGLGMP
ncbi:MAG: hypothetical protein D6806_17725 [Deltaproteobacteria bacterium]|nr:MAG: hypothetical protein D6806_17725 [Deltaproteobacteria bacterium]